MKYFIKNDLICNDPYKEVTFEELQMFLQEHTDRDCRVLVLMKIENNGMYYAYCEYEC